MKKTIFYTLTAAIFLTTSCSNSIKENKVGDVQISDKANTASFTVDGATCKGKVSTQYFGSNKETDNFSVLCQQDEPLTLLQATFANEKNAKTVGLKPKGGSYKVNEGEFGLTLTIAGSDKEFVANDKSGGSLKIDGNKMTITNMKLFDRDGKEKIVASEIEF
jgi:hypothetical protein